MGDPIFFECLSFFLKLLTPVCVMVESHSMVNVLKLFLVAILFKDLQRPKMGRPEQREREKRKAAKSCPPIGNFFVPLKKKTKEGKRVYLYILNYISNT